MPCYCRYSGEQWASSYCTRKGLIRKAHLAHNLKKWAAKHPHGLLAASVPETHIMEVDDVEYIDEALADVYEVCAAFAPSHTPGSSQSRERLLDVTPTSILSRGNPLKHC